MNTPITRHNFDAVNRSIDREQYRAAALLKDARASRWLVWGSVAIRFGLALAALVLAFGLIAWLLGMSDGIRVYNLGPSGAGEEQISDLHEAIEHIGARIDGLQDGQVIRGLVPQLEGTAATSNVTEKFTIFRTVELENNETVVTGRNFLPDAIDQPESQYCYHTVRREGGSFRTELQHRPAGGPVQAFQDVSARLSLLGKAHCKFRGD